MILLDATFGPKRQKKRSNFLSHGPLLLLMFRVCECCHRCQKRRSTVYDRNPIIPLPRDEVPFDCLVMDCLGPLMPSQKVEFNYALVLCDSNTRYSFAFPLRSLSAKNVCNALLQLFQIIGIPSTIRSDCGSNFTSSLTTTLLKLLGCTPNFNVPIDPEWSP